MAIQTLQADLDDPAHGAAVLDLLDAYARDPMGGEHALGPETRARLLPGLRAQPGARVFLAYVSGAPVGVAICFLGFSTFAARPLINVHDLGVLPEHRGRGAGRALLQAVQACAEREGCCRITLEVRADNERARALYKSFGFGDAELGGRAAPTLFLARQLAPR
jgi:ribosomal protein S18 acetylase RimI-like enzyme